MELRYPQPTEIASERDWVQLDTGRSCLYRAAVAVLCALLDWQTCLQAYYYTTPPGTLNAPLPIPPFGLLTFVSTAPAIPPHKEAAHATEQLVPGGLRQVGTHSLV